MRSEGFRYNSRRAPAVLLVAILLSMLLVHSPSGQAAVGPPLSEAPAAGESASGDGRVKPAVDAASESPGARPRMRIDPNSKAAHAELVRKASSGSISLYFLGDSITRRWGSADEQYRALHENWTHNFYGWNAADFGWGGDTTENILWRIENGELDGVMPKVIVLLAGTNNLKSPDIPRMDDVRVESVVDGVKAILSACRARAPDATIVLMGVTPRNDDMTLMPLIREINVRLAKLAEGRRIRFLNINRKLSDGRDLLYPGMVDPDGLHLAVNGYQVWADGLRPILTELLGPRAATDTAPPASSNPGIIIH